MQKKFRRPYGQPPEDVRLEKAFADADSIANPERYRSGALFWSSGTTSRTVSTPSVTVKRTSSPA